MKSRWNVRPVSIGNIKNNVANLERKIIPINSPILVGTLADYIPFPKGDWDYELVQLGRDSSGFLLSELRRKKHFASSIVENLVIEYALRINPFKYRHISCFHSVFGTMKDELYVADLFSKNGTYKDEQRINPESTMQIPDESIVKLGGLKDDCAMFKFYETIKNVRAVFLSYDHRGDWGMSKSAVKNMQNLLKQFNIPYEITTLQDTKLTKARIITVLEDACRMSDKDLFFFFCSTHGSAKGLETSDEHLVEKELLSSYLNKIPARKLIVIEACYAGGGWEELDLENGLYFFSSKEDEFSQGSSFAKGFASALEEKLKCSSPFDIKNFDITSICLDKQTPLKKGYKSFVL